ncbi:MAG: PAS domain-containing protein [Spirochaetales bacterium]|nr:PAS domain-containing protein [Spirochaetales bacterium]
MSIDIIHNDQEEFIGFLEIQRDITEKNRNKNDLKRNIEILNRSQKMAHVGSWVLDLEIDELEWTDEEYRIFGLKKTISKLTYQTFLNAVHPDDREMVNRVYTSAIKNIEPYDVIHRIIRPDNKVRIVREKSHDIIDDNGKAILSIGMTQDITEQTDLLNTIERQESNPIYSFIN